MSVMRISFRLILLTLYVCKPRSRLSGHRKSHFPCWSGVSQCEDQLPGSCARVGFFLILNGQHRTDELWTGSQRLLLESLFWDCLCIWRWVSFSLVQQTFLECPPCPRLPAARFLQTPGDVERTQLESRGVLGPAQHLRPRCSLSWQQSGGPS